MDIKKRFPGLERQVTCRITGDACAPDCPGRRDSMNALEKTGAGAVIGQIKSLSPKQAEPALHARVTWFVNEARRMNKPLQCDNLTPRD